MKKLDSIQGVRAIAVVLVVLAHLLRMEQKYSPSPILPEWLFSGISGVDLFFVISGFIMVTVTRGRFQNPSYLKEFAYHRLTRIYPVFWFYASITLGIFLYNPALVNQGNPGDLIATFLLLPQWQIPLVNVSWTLPHELYFYSVFALLLLFPQRLLLRGLCLWAVLVTFLHFSLKTHSVYLTLISNPLTYEFIAGAFIAYLHDRYPQIKGFGKRRSLLIFGLSLLALIANYCLYHQTQPLPPDGIIRIALFGLPAALAVFSLVQAEKEGFRVPQTLVTIGNASYSIYLSHIMVLSALSRVLYKYSSTPFAKLFVTAALVLAALIAGRLSYEKLEKPLLRWFREQLESSRSESYTNPSLRA